MPFETYSFDLNKALDGGLADDGMNMIVGVPKSGKTTLAIDLAARYMRRPRSGNVVVISRDLTAWNEAVRQKALPQKVILSRSVGPTVGLQRALTIAEVSAVGTSYYVGDEPFALAQVVLPNTCTVFLASFIQGMLQTSFNAILEMKVQGSVHRVSIFKNRFGQCGEFDITRKHIPLDRTKDQSALDMLLDDDDMV